MANPPTINAAARSRERKGPTTKAAPLTAEQRKEKREAHDETAQVIAADVGAWYSSTMAKVEELAEKYHKKPRYFLDLFFHGGARLVNERGTTAWNAFLSKKADEVNRGKSMLSAFAVSVLNFSYDLDSSHPMSLHEIQQEHRDEYDELTKEEKEELIREFINEKDGLKRVRRPSAKGRLQDALNVVRNMQKLVSLPFYSRHA
jgi:hypothetical protein